MELQKKVDTWRERAKTLQQERWGFVQKWRTENLVASHAAAVAEEANKKAISEATSVGAATSGASIKGGGGLEGDGEDDTPLYSESSESNEDIETEGERGSNESSDSW